MARRRLISLACGSGEGQNGAGENVRAALHLISRGEAPLGIVYATDAHADPNVKVLDGFLEGTHPPIIYPVAETAARRTRIRKLSSLI